WIYKETITTVERDCEVAVNVKLEILLDDEKGPVLRACKGTFKWTRKPMDITAFGISIVDISKIVEEKITQHLNEIVTTIKMEIEEKLKSFPTIKKSAFIFPKLRKDCWIFASYRRLGLAVDKTTPRFLEIQTVKDKTRLKLRGRYQIPIQFIETSIVSESDIYHELL